MTGPARLSDLGLEQFVQLTTYRRSGEAVPTPVCVVEDRGEVRRLTRALVAKYGLLARLFFAADRLRPERQRVVLRLLPPG